MENKEFKLIDKIDLRPKELSSAAFVKNEIVITVKDVKEFIKRLKSEIFKQEMKPRYGLYYCDLDTIIDKLTGFEDDTH